MLTVHTEIWHHIIFLYSEVNKCDEKRKEYHYTLLSRSSFLISILDQKSIPAKNFILHHKMFIIYCSEGNSLHLTHCGISQTNCVGQFTVESL
jgi:hypothetical protein